MTARAKTPSVKAPLASALTVLVMLLAGGPASAFYAPAGAKPTGNPADPYMNPNDGMCVIGVDINGNMLVDWSITNARDCVAMTKASDGSNDLSGMTAVDATALSICGATGTGPCNTQAACTRPDAGVVWNQYTLKCLDIRSCVFAGYTGNDGYKHAWSNSICFDTANNQGLSRVDLDNTNAMCVSKGGTTIYSGKCVAYGWVYRNTLFNGPPPTLPITGSGVNTTPGVPAGAGLGFCYTAIRMTGGSYTSATCPSFHNSQTTAPAEWPACLSNATGCQTQASYDAGLGWSFSSGNCVYAFGLTGTSNAAVTNAAGVVTAAGSSVNPGAITDQGDCLAAGFSWDNWLVSTGTTTKTQADGGDYAGMPAGAVIRKLNALTQDTEGPTDFYSGTGFNCLRCHSDQSRAYQERNKPGLVKSRHLRAGDDPTKPFYQYFNLSTSSWQLDGVQCAMCHSTARPAQDDLIQVVPLGVAGAGNPKSATGHNQTEYGAHLLDICYTCHAQHPANPAVDNPAAHIPVALGDFALTNNTPGPPVSNLGSLGPGTTQPPNVGGLAPIFNQFLNSPHALYGAPGALSPTGMKVDIGDKRNYGSPFEGYVCRTAASTIPTVTAAWTSVTCPGFWGQPPGTTAAGCYFTAGSCTNPPGGSPSNSWNTTFDPVQYPFATSPSIAGVCSGVGLGSIITTYYRNGLAEKIPNVDTLSNPACTNPGDGTSASGAGGYWVKDGELSPGGTPSDTAQGNCMTCHDVHWALADTNPEAEAFRRECTTCHSHQDGSTSASGAPQIDLNNIAHLKTPGTPLEDWQTDPNASCETCHMPDSGGPSSSRMHLFRINTDPNYRTMGSPEVNLAIDPSTGYNAAWVDLNHACGQCHGGTGGTNKPGVPYLDNNQLSELAVGMHNLTGAVTYPTTFSVSTSGLTANVGAIVDCGGPCPTTPVPLNYTWDWGDSAEINAACTAAGAPQACCTGLGTGTCTATITGPQASPSASHLYLTGGSKTVALKVTWDLKKVGGATRTFTITAPGNGPVSFDADPINATCLGAGNPYDCCTDVGTGDCATCTFNPDTWTMSLSASASGGFPPLQMVFRWGDSSTAQIVQGLASPTGTVNASHHYLTTGGAPYTVTETVIDAKLNKDVRQCAVDATPARFQITGTVVNASNGGTPVGNASVKVKLGTTVVKSVYTAPDGTFALKGLRPATYKFKVSKSGFTFPAAQAVTVGPNYAFPAPIPGTQP